jgi:hypothetical protein
VFVSVTSQFWPLASSDEQGSLAREHHLWSIRVVSPSLPYLLQLFLGAFPSTAPSGTPTRFQATTRNTKKHAHREHRQIGKVWREDTAFYEGDCVAFGRSPYQAQCDIGKSPGFSKHWLCLATAGVDGKPIRHRGEFATDVEYREHDTVFVGGSAFVARCG